MLATPKPRAAAVIWPLALAAVLCIAPSQRSAADVPALKIEYSVDYSFWNTPDAKGPRIIVVIHNTPKGDYKVDVHAGPRGEIPARIVDQRNDGPKAEVWLKTARNRTIVTKVVWDGKPVPIQPPKKAR